MRARVVMWIVAASCSKHDAPPAPEPAGSGSATPIAVARDAAPPDAPATNDLTRQCWVMPPGVHCTVAPRGGAWYGKHCWRAVVAIEDHDQPAVREVTSKPSCVNDVAATAHLDLDFAFAAKDDPAKPCQPDGSCELELVVDDVKLAAETKRLHKRWLDGLVQDKRDREDAEHDKQIATNVDWNPIFEHFVQIDVEYYVEHDHVSRTEAERSVRDNGGIEMNLSPDLKPTYGQIKCALEATAPDTFRECFQPDEDAAAAGPAASDDAGKPGE